MRYVMIIAGDESNWFGADAPAGMLDEVNSWWDKWHAVGKIVQGGAELQPASTAKAVAAGADGLPTVTDGPYLEIKEVVGRFIHVVADDIDDAVAVASGWPGNPVGDRVEVRPVMERFSRLLASRRNRSTALRQAVITSQPGGFSGTPSVGQRLNASASASGNASSARSRSRRLRASTPSMPAASECHSRSIVARTSATRGMVKNFW